MSLNIRIRSLLFTIVSLALLSAGASSASAADDQEKAKPKGRLPAYFSAVVSQEQREKVYTIQARYSEQLDELIQQIDELKAARDKEVDSVLTPDQLRVVNEKRDAAKSRRSRSTQPAADAPIPTS